MNKVSALVLAGFMLLPLKSLSNESEAGDINFRGYIKSAVFDVDDPSGPTADTFSYSPGIGLSLNLKGRGKRVFTALELQSFDLDGNTSNIGQSVKGYTLIGGYEQRFNLTRKLKLWAGLGLAANFHEFTDRFTVAQDGFLGATYPDREENYFSGRLSGDIYFSAFGSRDWNFGIGAYYDTPFGDGVSALGMTFSLINQ